MSSIGSIFSNNTSAMQSMSRMQRPDPAQLAEKLFAKLDTDQQGYIEKSDLENAFGSLQGNNASNNIDELFARLDGDSDGKVTQDEFSTALKQVAEQLDQQFMQMRMQGGGNGGMPPPPPADDGGFTKDELASQLEEVGSTDGRRSTLLENIVNNFDAADTDGDGKVSFREARAYDRDSGGEQLAANGETSSGNVERQLMQQILQLMRAYGGDASGGTTGSDSGTSLSVAA